VGSDGAPQSTLQVPGAGSASLSRLDIEVTDTGFMLGGSVTVTSTAKGQTDGLAIPQFVALSFPDNADTEFGQVTALSTQAFIDKTSFDLTDDADATTDGSFSLSGTYNAFFREGFVSYIVTITAVPQDTAIAEPATLALAARRRRRA
jgi:hypothetical protein